MVTTPATPVATPRRKPAAGVVSPVARALIRSWWLWTYCRALVRSSRPPTGPRPVRASLRSRRLSDVVYRQLVADAATRPQEELNAGPGGHSGASVPSSATDLTPDIGSSDQPQPGPAPTTL